MVGRRREVSAALWVYRGERAASANYRAWPWLPTETDSAIYAKSARAGVLMVQKSTRSTTSIHFLQSELTFRRGDRTKTHRPRGPRWKKRDAVWLFRQSG